MTLDQRLRSPGHDTLTTDTATVAGWTVVSRATGFLRVVTIAAVLGPTYFGNTFQALNLLPNLTYELLAGGLISALLVPALVRRGVSGDRSEVARFASGFLGTALVLFGLVAIMLVLIGPLVLRMFGLGVRDQAALELQRNAGWLLLALVMPQLPLYGVVGTAAAVQNARGRFAFPAGAPVIENVGVVITLLVSAIAFGTGRDLDEVSSSQVLVLGLGSTISVAVHAGVQWWGARRCGITLIPRAGWRDPEVRSLARLARPSLGIAALIGVRYLALVVVASSVRGGVVAFTMAINFFNLPIALGAKPVATALLPRLASLVDRPARFSRELARGTGLALFVAVPAAVAFVALSVPLAKAAAFGEMSSERGVQLLAVSIAALAIGLVGETIVTVGTPASFALGDARSPLVSMVVRTLVTLPGMAVSLTLLEGRWVLAGLGLSLTLGDLAAGGVLWQRLRALTAPRVAVAGGLVRCLVASLVMVLPAVVAAWGVGALGSSAAVELTAVLAAGLVGAAIYGAVQWVLRAPELAPLSGLSSAQVQP